jgi:23S rRNA (pseudouridine1915-N3)-methyltransferase
MQYSFVTPWKLSSGPARNWSDDLLQRIQRFSPAQIISPTRTLENEKAAEQFLLAECEKIVQARGVLFFLDERGQNPTSQKLAHDLSAARDSGFRTAAFVFGGAYGLPSALQVYLKQARMLSLSELTFAHELALVVVLEQVYRSETIRANHPYHHGGASPLVATFKGRSGSQS